MTGGDLWQAFADAGLHVGMVALAAYLNYFLFLPRFLESRKIGRYLLQFLPIFAAIMAALIVLKRYQIDGYTRAVEFFYGTRFIVHVVVSSFLIVVFVGMLKFAEQWFALERRKKENENERLNSELRFLKAQINPHFLFNTLNNLYALALDQSPKTPDVIAQLSQMMRYMIYDSNHPKVPLDREIEYMKNYISLEKMRLTPETPINFEVEGRTEGLQIVPLILINFLENAFKHGVTCTAKSAWVKVHLKIEGKNANFEVENSKPINPAAVSKSGGMGLQIVRRRLELSYPNRHELDIEDLPDRFSVKLKIDL